MTETTPAAVAEQATMVAALPLDRLTLIGIMTTGDGQAALLRSPRGDILRVIPGTQTLGLTITGISDSTVTLVDKTGTAYVLAVPGN